MDISIGLIVLYVGFEYESPRYHFIFTAVLQQPVKSDRERGKRGMLFCRSRELLYKLWCHQSVLCAFQRSRSSRIEKKKKIHPAQSGSTFCWACKAAHFYTAHIFSQHCIKSVYFIFVCNHQTNLEATRPLRQGYLLELSGSCSQKDVVVVFFCLN